MSANDRQMWLAILAKLVAPMEPIAAVKALTPMIPMLAGYPDQAFTPSSAQHVATTGRILPDGKTAPLNRVPTFGELDVALGKWWRAKREMLAVQAQPIASPALSAPEPPLHEGQDPEAVDAVRRMVEAFKAERTFSQPQGSAARAKIKPAHGSDGQLLAAYEKLAREGSDAAATRAAMIRQRLGATA